MSSHYVYILVRKDLSNAQRVVQSSHVAWEIAKAYNLAEHPSMIVIGIRDEDKLKKESNKVEKGGFKVYKFHEPLFNNKLSAIAVLTNSEEEREFFKRYNLLSDESFYSKEEQLKLELKKCVHSKVKSAYRETMAFEFFPTKVCTKCYKDLRIELTDKEKIELVKEFFSDLELSLTDEEVQIKKEGFNI